MENNLNFGYLKHQHPNLDANTKIDESHIWKNILKAEELRRQQEKLKNEKLRQAMHSIKYL